MKLDFVSAVTAFAFMIFSDHCVGSFAFSVSTNLNGKYQCNKLCDSGKKALQPVTTITAFRQPSTTLMAASDELITILTISFGFAGAAIYTYKNPDTSNRIRSSWESLLEKQETGKATSVVESEPIIVSSSTPLSSGSTSTFVQISDMPTTVTSAQAELTSLLKDVSETVEVQSTKLDEIRLKRIDSTTTPSVTVTPVENTQMDEGSKKGKFIFKLFKKIIRPWKPWSSL